MRVYLYNEKTKELLEEKEAYLDALHSKKKGKEHYLIPANATDVKPHLGYKKGFAIVFDTEKNQWKYEEDHRGKELWIKDSSEKVTVDWIGAIGEEYTSVEPPKPEPVPPKLEDVQAQLALLTKQLGEIQKGVHNESQ